MLKNLFSLTVRVVGLNVNRLLINLQKQNICAKNFKCESVKSICFDLSFNNFKKAKLFFKQNNLKFEIIKYYGVLFLFNYFKNNLGMAIGLIVSILLFAVSNLFIWQVKIYGEETLCEKEISDVLNVNLLSLKSNINSSELENKIYERLDKVSLCSVSVKGLTLIVNIKERITLNENEVNTAENFVCNINGVVKSIEVQSGTANVEVGQTVRAGDILILGKFVDINSKSNLCKARGKVVVESYVYGTSTLKFEQWVEQRTGNFVVNEKLNLLGMDFIIKNNKNIFKDFEEETKESYVFKNNIFPLKITKQTFYETQWVKIEKNYEDNGDEHKILAKENAKNKLLSDMKILEEISFTSKIENGIIFTHGYKIEQTLSVE